MYEAFFNFSSRPFAATAQTQQYFAASAIEDARERLVRCIQRGEGHAMIIGPAGTGKTLLCRMLKEHFHDEFSVALLCSGRLGTRKALLQAILYELGRPYKQMDEGELRIALSDYLLGRRHDDESQPSAAMTEADRDESIDQTTREQVAQADAMPPKTVRGSLLLLIDEAQSIPLRLLEELRMLTNLAGPDGPGISLVLCGGPVLEERFASPRLESFSQQITTRCYLESFNRCETQRYLRERIDAVGGRGASMFDDPACQAVYQATDGVPRLINQVCDYALLLACSNGRERLCCRDIEEAWADLQQLPVPWNGEDAGETAAAGGGVGIVEFGGLDDEEDCAEQAQSKPSLAVGFDENAEDEADMETISMTAVDGDERSSPEPDDDFHPAGSIGPEVELTFGEAENPFDEPFEEEEEIAARRYEAAASLRPSLQEATVAQPQEVADESPQAEIDLSTPRPQQVEQYEAAAAETIEPATAAGTVVVLDSQRAESRTPLRSATKLRKHQYSQLFATLRRG